MSCSCSSGHKCGVCKTVGLIFGILFAVATVAALYGVYMAHNTPAGWIFGSPEGSLSLAAFALVGAMLLKSMKNCSCRSKGCGCGCGAQGGMCPGCGKDPCVCKKM